MGADDPVLDKGKHKDSHVAEDIAPTARTSPLRGGGYIMRINPMAIGTLVVSHLESV